MSVSKPKRRVMIGIPCFDKMHPEVVDDYFRLAYYLGRRYQEIDFYWAIKTKSEQFRARNHLIRAAQQMAVDFLLFLDDDHVFDWQGSNYPGECYEFLRKLLSHMDNDPRLGIIGALYYHRGGQCLPVALVWDKTQGEYRYLRDHELVGGPQKVDVTGGGVMLIRMEALKCVPDPWCEPEIDYGTDFQLCRKVANVGYTIAIDTSIEVGHLSNEVNIITPLNRHLTQADSGKLTKDLELAGRLGKIYQDFRNDVMEYLNIPNQGYLHDLMAQYQEHRERISDYRNRNALAEYYLDAGTGYLARAALIARLGTDWPSSWDDYLLRLIRTGNPAIGVEFGAGSGRLSFELARKGHKIYFIDIPGVPTYEFLKWRCDKYGLTGVTAFFDEWPEPGTCDYAIYSDVIEHLEDWQTPVLKGIECLKEGGALLTNFLLLLNDGNSEHIFMDRPVFVEWMRNMHMVPNNSAMWIKPLAREKAANE